MFQANWSDTLKSDLDKLSQLTGARKSSQTLELKEGERRIVTILFLDIQGFTAMSEKLDPEDVQLIIDHTFKILTGEIEKYNGYIDKYEGDRLMALFGSRHASEQDCAQALRAALGMKEKFVEINRIVAERDIEIGFRIGINTGLVVTGRIGKGRDQDFTVMGDAVNLASRLETNSPPGEAMVSKEVVKASGQVFVFKDLGEITVKGKSQPISVFTVSGVNRSYKERWERSPFTKRSGYVSREEEERFIEEELKSLEEDGYGAAVLGVTSSAGGGKSRLVYEFIKRWKNKKGNSPYWFKASTPPDHTLPLGIFSELFRKILQKNELLSDLVTVWDEERKEEAERLLPVLRYLAGLEEANDRIKSLEPKSLQLEIHLGIRLLLEGLAKLSKKKDSGPFIINLNDLHWLDAASTEALKFLGENLSPEHPIVFLLTYRPEFEMEKELPGSWKVDEVHLPPLGGAACKTIIKNVLGESTFSAREEDLLIRKSGGNPFFIEELIQSLVDDGIVVRERNTWKAVKEIEEGSLPDTVNRILLGRIDRLEKSLKETLMAGSVIGETFPVKLIEQVAERMGRERSKIANELAYLEEMGFIFRKREEGTLGPELAFRHALTRDVVYSTLLNHNKKILHEAVGTSLEKLYEGKLDEYAPMLFHHFIAAGSSEKALDYGLKSVEEMTRKYAAKEGVRTISELLPILKVAQSGEELHRTKAGLLESKIRFFDFLGDRKKQKESIDSLEKLAQDNPSLDFEICLAQANANYNYSLGEFKKTVESAQKGLDRLEAIDEEDTKGELELLRIKGIARYSLGDHQEALEVYASGIEISKEKKEEAFEAGFLNLIGLVHFNMGKPAESVEYYDQGLEIMTRLGDIRGMAIALGNQGLVYWTLGEYSVALSYLKRSNRTFEQIGYKKGQAVTLGNIGVNFHKVGQFGEAVRHYEKALELRKEIRDRSGEGFDLVNIGVVHQHMGDLDQAQEFYGRALEIAKEVGSKYLHVESINGLIVVYRKRGETDSDFLEKSKSLAEEGLDLAAQHKLIPAQVKIKSNLARTLLLMGKKAEACVMSKDAIATIEKEHLGVEGAEEDAFMNHYHIAKECGQDQDARRVLKKLVDLIQDRASKIKEDDFRKSFLENVRQNRFALEEWDRFGA